MMVVVTNSELKRAQTTNGSDHVDWRKVQNIIVARYETQHIHIGENMNVQKILDCEFFFAVCEEPDVLLHPAYHTVIGKCRHCI